jgi:hypothetical protein
MLFGRDERDVLVSVDAFSLHNFHARNIYPDEMLCFFLLPNVLVDCVM